MIPNANLINICHMCGKRMTRGEIFTFPYGHCYHEMSGMPYGYCASCAAKFINETTKKFDEWTNDILEI